MNEIELKKIFIDLIKYFDLDDNGEIFIYDELLEKYTSFDKTNLIKDKIKKLLLISNEIKNKSEDEFQKFLDRDLENDIWFLL